MILRGWRRHARTTSLRHSSAIFHFIQGQSLAVLRHRRPQWYTGSILLTFYKDLTRLPLRSIKTDSGIGPRHVVHSSQGEYNKQLALRTITLLSVVSHTHSKQALRPHLPTCSPPASLLWCHKYPCGSSNMPNMLQIWDHSSACNTLPIRILSGPTPIALSGSLIRELSRHCI